MIQIYFIYTSGSQTFFIQTSLKIKKNNEEMKYNFYYLNIKSITIDTIYLRYYKKINFNANNVLVNRVLMPQN